MPFPSLYCCLCRRFNVYVAQPEVKPGCVLRRANIGLLEKKKLVTDKEVSVCIVQPGTALFTMTCLLRAISTALFLSFRACKGTARFILLMSLPPADTNTADVMQVSACTKSMNTFGFVGDLNKSPEVSCVYHSEDGENQFLRDPKKSVMGDGFQPHELQDGSGSTTQLPAQN